MKLALSALLAGALVLPFAISARAADKVENGAKNTAKTTAHGTTSVGKGISKVFHDTASGVHKVIAKNAGNKKTRAKHMHKAAVQHKQAAEKSHQAKSEMKKAEKASDKVGK